MYFYILLWLYVYLFWCIIYVQGECCTFYTQYTTCVCYTELLIKNGGVKMQEIANYSTEIISNKQITTAMLQDFMDFIDASAKTKETYQKALRQFFKYIQNNGIAQPTQKDVIAFRDDLKVDHAASTVQGYMVAVKLFFRWANSKGLYDNISDNIKGAKITEGHKKDYLTSKQASRVLNSIDRTTLKGQRDYAICSLMIATGLRDIEVVNLNVEDMRTLGDSTVLYLLGKGRDEKKDFVKLTDTVEGIIRDYLKAADIHSGDSPMFTSLSNNNNKKRLTTRSVSRICKNALLTAGFDSDRLTAHSFRHTAVTLALLGGCSLQEAQQFARHNKITTTQIYAHNLDRMKNKCEETISKAIF